MYEPVHFRVQDPQRLREVMAQFPLGLLVSAGEAGLVANAVPFQFHPDLGQQGVLRTHLARANPQWQALTNAGEVLVVFQGVQRYVSPTLYASKTEHGRVVPTWNYVMVQARGKAQVHEEAGWLRHQIGQITDRQEMGQPAPWAVDDAPLDFISAQMRAIVGVEIAVSDLRGKFKVSQNRPPQDRASVLEALDQSNDDDDRAMAQLLRQSVTGD